MYRNNIKIDVLQLLEKGKYEKAFHLFRQQCTEYDDCDHRRDINTCVSLCLLPKLTFISLSHKDKNLDAIIAGVKKELEKE